MTREDLIKFSINQKWKKARINFYKEQLETINRLNSVLSDMPKGSRQVYDNEAENLIKLIDQINDLIEDIRNSTVEMENKVNKELEKLEPKYGLLLYHHYIIGDSIKYIAKDILHYREKYVYELKQEALDRFDELGK